MTDGVDGAGSGGGSDASSAAPDISDSAKDSLNQGGDNRTDDRHSDTATADARAPSHGYDGAGMDLAANDPGEPTQAERAASQERMEADAKAAKQAYEAKQAETYADALDQEVAALNEAATEKPQRGRQEPVAVEMATAPVTVDGVSYSVGPDARPSIQHDNGFLQNPNDPKDPTPQPTRAPTQAEQAYYDSHVLSVNAAQIAGTIPGSGLIDDRLALDHALPAYDHFLTGEGANRSFDYEAYVAEDPSGQALKADVMGDVREAADAIYADLTTQVPDMPGASVTFEMNSAAMPIGGGFDPNRAYPATEDWQKAIGGHIAWTNSDITVTRQTDGTLVATAQIELNAEDRYNFNRGQADIATGAPDQLRGVLEEAGLAQQYTQTGQARFETSWTIGAPANATTANGAPLADR